MNLIFTCLLVATSISYSLSLTINQQSYSECTDVEKEHVSYNWTLRNVNLMLNGNEPKISSPHFFTRNKTDKWRIDFYPTGLKTDDDEWVSVYLQLVSSQKLGFNAQWKMTLSKSDKVLKNLDYTYMFKVLEGYGNQYFFKRSELLTRDGHEMTIRCELDLPLRIIEVPCKKPKIPETLADDLQKHTLVDDFRSLFQNMNLSDVIIIAENERFPAHKAVLMARSPIFADILKQQENEEISSNILAIDNMVPTEVMGMLEFMYTDNVTDLQELAHGLLAAADRFQLHRLKAMCEEVLYRELNVARAADTLMFAHLYHSHELKTYTLEFISEHLAEVSLTEGYKKMTMMHPVLLSEVIQSVVPKISEPHSS